MSGEDRTRPFAGQPSKQERQQRYRSERSPDNDDWTPQELALNRAAKDLSEARRAVERAEAELQIQIAVAVTDEEMLLERVQYLTGLDEDQLLAQLAAIERRDRGLDLHSVTRRNDRLPAALFGRVRGATAAQVRDLANGATDAQVYCLGCCVEQRPATRFVPRGAA